MLRLVEHFISPRSKSRTVGYRKQLAQSIVDTVREPLIALDSELRVVAASLSFYTTFQVNPRETEGRLIYELGDGEWNIPTLRALLEKILPDHGVMDGYEVQHEFPQLGSRIMLLNAREISYSEDADPGILLAIEDVTERRLEERQLHGLLEQKELLLEEMQHRIGNSLQIIASILMLKARSVQSEDSRSHLKDAHARVMSVVAVQELLQPGAWGERIPVGPYLSNLCAKLAQSMIGTTRNIVLEATANEGTLLSKEVVSIGLIVTESVINALKHAFPLVTSSGAITVAYEEKGDGWTLSIADNGCGMPSEEMAGIKPGLGTSIVTALAGQLAARVSVTSGSGGTTVTVTHDRLAIPVGTSRDENESGLDQGPLLLQRA
jgi:chemotaxis protein methyltransferase CheR